MTIFASKLRRKMTESRKLNRIKAVLAEKGKTNKWLGEQVGKSEFTVSRWATNKLQPSVQQLFEIASSLQVEVKDLLVSQEEAKLSSL